MKLFERQKDDKSISSPKPNFIDVSIRDIVLRLFEQNKKSFESQGLQVTFEGYCFNLPEQGYRPIMIVQNKEQLSVLKDGIIDGKLYSQSNDWTSYINGKFTDSGILFYETNSLVTIRMFSTNEGALSLRNFNYATDIDSTRCIYDAKKDENVYRGNFYYPPRVSEGVNEDIIFPSSTGRFCIRRV